MTLRNQNEYTMYVENFLEILKKGIEHKGLNSNTVKMIVVIIMPRKVIRWTALCWMSVWQVL